MLIRYSEVLKKMPKKLWIQGDYYDGMTGKMCNMGYLGKQLDDNMYSGLQMLMYTLKSSEFFHLIDINDKAKTFEEARDKSVKYLLSIGY